MSWDWDRHIERVGTHSYKYDNREKFFGADDVIPLWVADMDFAAPEAVTQALSARAVHPIYGYSVFSESLYAAALDWLRVRHGWNVAREAMLLAPGVVPSLSVAVQCFTQPGDGVIVQPPVYFPFFSAVTDNQRKLMQNPLRLVEGRYRFDLEHLEQCAREGAKLLLLCSPHNPVGRVWAPQELQDVLRITRQYGMVVLSDEIHADLIYPEYRHTVLQTLATPEDRIITTMAPSKTFNIPGMGLSFLVVENADDRIKLAKLFQSWHLPQCNPFSSTAFEAAYRNGGPWLDSLLRYIQGTRDVVAQFLQTHLPQIKLIAPEGTYLLWLDCRALGMDDKALHEFFVQKARLGLSPGTGFGVDGSGFMRLNIGAPRPLIEESLWRLQRAAQQLSQT